MISKINGIKSVDFKITAIGHGAVNWNGSIEVMGPDGLIIKNHSIPKLRGYTNLSGKFKDNDESGFEYRKRADQMDFQKNPLYISQNCIRHWLFKEQAMDGHFANNDVMGMLCSITGLLRGYMIAKPGLKRASPVLIEDFVDSIGSGTFEQMSRSGPKTGGTSVNDSGVTVKTKSTSFFSKTTFGDTAYTSYGSINIEQLSFIPLDKKFDRCAMQLSKGMQEGVQVATKMTDLIQTILAEMLDDKSTDCIESNNEMTRKKLTPLVSFHKNYVRQGTIFNQGECGLLLNDDAISVMVEKMLRMIKNLSITQAKGWMTVDDVKVDYNSGKMMRIKSDESLICEQRIDGSKFAEYFTPQDEASTMEIVED